MNLSVSPTHMYVHHTHACAHGDQKKIPDSLELGLLLTGWLGTMMGMLETESVRATSVL